MSNFKVIAIKTGAHGISPRNYLQMADTAVDVDYLKNLLPNTVYSFYSQYSFPNNDFSEVIYDVLNDVDLYRIQLSDSTYKDISISAVAGENGSGKSTLLELIYWLNYNIGSKFDLLEDESSGELYQMNNELELELCYCTSKEDLHIIKFNKEDIYQFTGRFANNKVSINDESIWLKISSLKDLSDYFYSLVINYSQFSLNSLEVGDWVNALFHKNDGYQTPIALNPMRNEGNIDVNKERLLLSRRLQANVLEDLNGVDEKNSLRSLANNKIAKELEIEYNQNYFKNLEDNEKKKGEEIISDKDFIETKNTILELFSFQLIGQGPNFIHFSELVIKYVYYKIKKIARNYVRYRKYYSSGSIDISNLLKEMYTTNSHISYKLKGAILHLKYFDKIYRNSKFNFDHPFKVDIEYFSGLIKNEIKEDFFINTYMMALPSFFNVDVIFDAPLLSLRTFSSGEKQKIYSMSSIVYHLTNLNSVEEQESTTSLIKYNYINLVLDEIELYYHPEWQRRYITDLLDYIKKTNPDNLRNIQGINILFVTHSPFILSDIPSSNVLLLTKEKSNDPLSKVIAESAGKKMKTFGANIHELLSHSFFMKSTMGEFAKDLVNEIVRFHHQVQSADQSQYLDLKEKYAAKEKVFRFVVENIGEDFIRGILQNHVGFIEQSLDWHPSNN